MFAVRFAPLLALTLALQFYAVAAGLSLPPLLGRVCEEVNVCGKGNCVESSNSTFGFECQCDAGWKQTRSNDDHHFNFLPCIIPNCTLNNTCANATAIPPLNQTVPANSTVFDPCYWAQCGGGSCKKRSLVSRSCTCNPGYYNLFNSTDFPCYKKCELGLQCAQLGIGLTNSSNATPPAAPASHGTSLLPRVDCSWPIAVFTTLVIWAQVQ